MTAAVPQATLGLFCADQPQGIATFGLVCESLVPALGWVKVLGFDLEVSKSVEFNLPRWYTKGNDKVL